MLIDDIHAGVAPLWEKTLSIRVIEVLLRLIRIRFEGPNSIGHGYTEQAARLKDTQGFLQKPAYLIGISEMFKKVFAVDLHCRIVGERQRFPQIELQIGIPMKKIDVDPPGLGIRSAAELNPVGRPHLHLAHPGKSPKVLSLDLTFDANIPNSVTKSTRRARPDELAQAH